MLEDKIEYNIIREFAPDSQSTYYNLFYTVQAKPLAPCVPHAARGRDGHI